MAISTSELNAGKFLKHLINNTSTHQEAVDIFNAHAQHLDANTHEEMVELVAELL